MNDELGGASAEPVRVQSSSVEQYGPVDRQVRRKVLFLVSFLLARDLLQAAPVLRFSA